MFRVFLLLLSIIIVSQATVRREDVTYFLFTKDNPKDSIELGYENSNKHLDPEAEIVFLIHGWTQNHLHHSYELLKNAFLSRTDKTYNVIEVDYGEIAAQQYYKVIKDVLEVGEIIGDFIIHIEGKGISLKNIHLVGHSLGAHVAGYAGKRVQEKLSRKIRRITGLDPAGPFFQGYVTSNQNRLKQHDAEIVFVLHTDRLMFGVRSSCGTIDVYPNGGGNQPGCPDYFRGEIFFCSHHKSYEQFADAVANPGTLIATKCISYAAFDEGECKGNRKIDVGGDFTRDDDGNYYLHTNAVEPFGKKE